MTPLQKQIAQVYEKEFVQPTQQVLPEIKKRFKPEYEDYTEGSCSCNRSKYFEKNRSTDVIHIISRAFPEITGKKLKILDLGCAFGEFSSIFRGFGHDVTAINGGETWYTDDFDFVTQNVLALKCEQSDVLKGLPYQDKAFDVVYASEILTLDTLKDHSNVILEELTRVASRVIVVNHKGRCLNYDCSRFSPEIHVANKDHLNIFTFFAGERYKSLAADLLESGRRIGYHIHPVHIPDKHNWGSNLCEKPRLIYKYYLKLGPPLLYIDADCLIVKPLFEIADVLRKFPLAIRERHLEDRFNAGVMGFGKHYLMEALLKKWYLFTKEKLGQSATVDQKPFQHILEQEPYKRVMKVHNLTAKYNYLPADCVDSGINREDAHILHLKESKDNKLARAWRNKTLGMDG